MFRQFLLGRLTGLDVKEAVRTTLLADDHRRDERATLAGMPVTLQRNVGMRRAAPPHRWHSTDLTVAEDLDTAGLAAVADLRLRFVPGCPPLLRVTDDADLVRLEQARQPGPPLHEASNLSREKASMAAVSSGFGSSTGVYVASALSRTQPYRAVQIGTNDGSAP